MGRKQAFFSHRKYLSISEDWTCAEEDVEDGRESEAAVEEVETNAEGACCEFP